MFGRKRKELERELKVANQLIKRYHNLLKRNLSYVDMKKEVEYLMYCNGVEAMEQERYGWKNKPREYYQGFATCCKNMIDFLEGKES